MLPSWADLRSFSDYLFRPLTAIEPLKRPGARSTFPALRSLSEFLTLRVTPARPWQDDQKRLPRQRLLCDFRFRFLWLRLSGINARLAIGWRLLQHWDCKRKKVMSNFQIILRVTTSSSLGESLLRFILRHWNEYFLVLKSWYETSRKFTFCFDASLKW